MYSLKIYINNIQFNWDNKDIPIDVKDTDYIFFKVQIDLEAVESIGFPIILIEDYELPIKILEEGVYVTESFNIFRESFGYSVCRLFFDDTEYTEILFNVHISKNKANHVENIINYLLINNERILDLCLSRTSVNISGYSSESANIESFLTESEKIINKMMDFRHELKYSLKKRLSKVLEPSSNKLENLEPLDIINNIDRLKPDDLNHTFQFKGAGFSLSAGDIWILKEDANLFENHVLIGVLYSIKDKIEQINENCFTKKLLNHSSSFDKEYESLDGMYIRITLKGVQSRCKIILDKTSDLIVYFRNTLKVDYRGSLYPVITPFVRSFKVYNILFHQIALWYELGNPSLDGTKSLAKIRSISKLYELLCFYKFIEFFEKDNWKFVSCEQFDEENIVPSVVNISKGDVLISLIYEKKINIPNDMTKHNDLVDISHYSSSRYPFWNPDFVLKIINGNTSYMILDSKFSSLGSLKKYNVLSSIYDKYYTNIGVLDRNLNKISKEGIDGIIALYPNYDNKIINNWGEASNNFKIVPQLNAIPITTESDYIFNDFLGKYLIDKL